MTFQNHVTGNVLFFLDLRYDNSLSKVNFFLFLSIRNCFICCLSFRRKMNIFESLVVLNIENHTVELTDLTYSQEFHNLNIKWCIISLHMFGKEVIS